MIRFLRRLRTGYRLIGDLDTLRAAVTDGRIASSWWMNSGYGTRKAQVGMWDETRPAGEDVYIVGDGQEYEALVHQLAERVRGMGQ